MEEKLVLRNAGHKLLRKFEMKDRGLLTLLAISVGVTYMNYWIFRLLQHVSLLNKRRRQVIHALTHDNGMDASRGPSNWWFKFMYILQIHSTMHGYIYIYNG